jgi:Anti-sigma-K factor rskA
VSHLDPEVVALIALGQDPPEAPGAAGQNAAGQNAGEHLAGCADCRSEVDEFAAVVAVARRGDGAPSLTPPPPDLWDRIAAAAGLDTDHPAPVPAGVSDPEVPATPADPAPADPTPADPAPADPAPARPARPLRPWWRRRPVAAGLAAAAAGLIIGAGGAIGVHQLTRPPAARVVASIPLRPLAQFPQWHGASGTAVMATGPDGRQLTVRLTAPRRPGFYEVWLLARNGVSMISLGDLDAAHAGKFVMPPGVDLRNYSRIDVSLQPFNGSTQHARTSVVRGALPAP